MTPSGTPCLSRPSCHTSYVWARDTGIFMGIMTGEGRDFGRFVGYFPPQHLSLIVTIMSDQKVV